MGFGGDFSQNEAFPNPILYPRDPSLSAPRFCHPEAIRTRFQELRDRRRRLQTQHLHVHGEFDRVARMAKLLVPSRTKIAGINPEMAAKNSSIEWLHETNIAERSFDEFFATIHPTADSKI